VSTRHTVSDTPRHACRKIWVPCRATLKISAWYCAPSNVNEAKGLGTVGTLQLACQSTTRPSNCDTQMVIQFMKASAPRLFLRWFTGSRSRRPRWQRHHRPQAGIANAAAAGGCRGRASGAPSGSCTRAPPRPSSASGRWALTLTLALGVQLVALLEPAAQGTRHCSR